MFVSVQKSVGTVIQQGMSTIDFFLHAIMLVGLNLTLRCDEVQKMEIDNVSINQKITKKRLSCTHYSNKDKEQYNSPQMRDSRMAWKHKNQKIYGVLSVHSNACVAFST